MVGFGEWLVLREGSLGLKRRERVAAGLRRRAGAELSSPGSDPSVWDDAASALGRFQSAGDDQQRRSMRRLAAGMERKSRRGWADRLLGRRGGESIPDADDRRTMRDMGRSYGVLSSLDSLDGSGAWARGERASAIRSLSRIGADSSRDHLRAGSDLDARVASYAARDLRGLGR